MPVELLRRVAACVCGAMFVVCHCVYVSLWLSVFGCGSQAASVVRSQRLTKALSKLLGPRNWQRTPGLSCNVEDPSSYRKCVLLSLTTAGRARFCSQSRPHLSRPQAQSSVPTQTLPRAQAQTWLYRSSVYRASSLHRALGTSAGIHPQAHGFLFPFHRRGH